MILVMNIPATLLKEVEDFAADPLAKIWNTEIIVNEKFPTRLKLAGITPLFRSCLLERLYPLNLKNLNNRNAAISIEFRSFLLA